jgi:predicted nucleic acid-binding protein
MPLHFLDSSALSKRYLAEVGSAWVDSLCAGDTIAVSSLVAIELTSAFARRAREGSLTVTQRDELLRAFLTDRSEMLVQRLTNPIIQHAMTILLTCPPSVALRALDAIQLASAQHAFNRARQDGILVGIFVTSDTRLLSAAQWAGLATDNPEDHP